MSDRRSNSVTEEANSLEVDGVAEVVADGRAARTRAIARARLLWENRRKLTRCAGTGFVLGLLLALLIHNQYISTTRLMPPEQGSGSSTVAMMAVMAGKVNDSIGNLSNLLPGMKTTGALFIGVLGSRTVQDDLIQKFDLRKEYRLSRWEDARRRLAANTEIAEDKKSGIITINVTDPDPRRAADMASEYVVALNRVVVDLNTSSAHRERVFLEERLVQVKQDLEAAEKDFSEFASKNAAIDIQAQGRAMVESAASLEGELIAAQTQLQGLRQIYADSNVRVRATQARINELIRQIQKLGGKADTSGTIPTHADTDSLYPTIRKLPLLGVTFADLFRRTKIQEVVFETLTKQYELAKVDEAKEVPSVRVLDPSTVPEKKSFPPRLIITMLGTLIAFLGGVVWIFSREAWTQWDTQDPGRALIAEVGHTLHARLARASSNGHNRLPVWSRFVWRAKGQGVSGNDAEPLVSGIASPTVNNRNGGRPDMQWNRKRVVVTGGASFIGSALVDALVERGADVRVIDNLSSGTRSNLREHINSKRIEFLEGDLLEPETCRAAVEGRDLVFHLAADHGGRGYVDLHQVACSTNLILDGLLFRACHRAGVEKVVFASSGCVYPNFLQTDPGEVLYLTEDQAGPPCDADNLYGWAKLMAEKTLQSYHSEYGMKSASCRYFTVYGERGHENHAVIAMIARAFVKQDPFVVWGTGEQIRNWTYVGDIVEGTLRAAEVIEDGTAVNLGTMERIRVLDAVDEVLRYAGHKAKIDLHPELPTGPLNRVADNSLARNLLGWEARVKFVDGLHRTIDWYFGTKNRDEVSSILDQILTERTAKSAVSQAA